MKHKYAELIHAWADGAEIECKADSSNLNDWIPCPHPFWDDDSVEFRIKPKELKKHTLFLYNNAIEGKSWITTQPNDRTILPKDWEYMGSIEVTK